MHSIPAVILAHACSCLLRGTERRYTPTESNCFISVYSYSPRGWWNLSLSQYWLWCPIIAPILGAQVGIGFYDLFLKKRDSADSFAPMWVSLLCLHFFGWLIITDGFLVSRRVQCNRPDLISSVFDCLFWWVDIVEHGMALFFIEFDIIFSL